MRPTPYRESARPAGRVPGSGLQAAIRPVPFSGCDLLRAADRWAEVEEFVGHVPPRADEDSRVRLFEELGRLHAALGSAWEPGPPGPLDDHRTFGQLRYPAGFTRRRLGPRREPAVHRMRQLTGELSRLAKAVELPCAPVYGDCKPGSAGELPDGSRATFDGLVVAPAELSS